MFFLLKRSNFYLPFTKKDLVSQSPGSCIYSVREVTGDGILHVCWWSYCLIILVCCHFLLYLFESGSINWLYVKMPRRVWQKLSLSLECGCICRNHDEWLFLKLSCLPVMPHAEVSQAHGASPFGWLNGAYVCSILVSRVTTCLSLPGLRYPPDRRFSVFKSGKSWDSWENLVTSIPEVLCLILKLLSFLFLFCST